MKGKVEKFLCNSFINYLSDLFIAAMVILWIVDNLYETVVASIVTFSSVVLSHQMGYACYDTTMWTSIGTNIAIPLSAGGALWMIKNAIQHKMFNEQGKEAPSDFPKVDDTEIEFEEPLCSSDTDEEEVCG